MRMFTSSERYVELEEEPAVLTPLHPTAMLRPEHFSTPLAQLRFPVKLDFSHERFRLRSLSLLSQLKETALQDIDLSDNELQSIVELNRFTALKTLCARRNYLASGGGVHLAVHRLARLDLSDNRLTAVLNMSRNRISEGWGELAHCSSLQALDGSQNLLDWESDTGELRQAMVVLRGLKRLRVLNLSQNPTALRSGYRSWVIANARRLEVFDNEGVSEAEREGADVASHTVDAPSRKEPQPRSDDADASRVTQATFGVPLAELLQQDVATLPRLVQECTRHVQERAVPDQAVLTADGDPSLVLLLRNAFERGGDAGRGALLDCMDGSSDADVRAACSVLRTFLLELPQPVVPVDYFLPLLEAARGGAADGEQLERILAPMASEHWALLEHLLCFLVNASRPFPDAGFQQLLARVWAPCILRAPARVMSQYRGKVIDAMAACILGLLRERRGGGGSTGSDAGEQAATHGARAEVELRTAAEGSDERPLSSDSRKRSALLDSLDELPSAQQPQTAQLIDVGDSEMAAVDTAELPAVLARQRASADELLSALEELQDDCSILDDSTASMPTPHAIATMPEPTVKSESEARCASANEATLCVAPSSPVHSSPPTPLPPAPALQLMSPEPPPQPVHAAARPTWDVSPAATPYDEDAVSMSRLSVSSHQMASAATAALEAREAEATKLKQHAQRLLRKRSELALDLEGLQDTLSRMERAIARAQEQAQALRTERSRYDTSDSRRHSAQISTLSKAVLREKQRRLAARNEVGALQRQLTKKRTQHQAVTARRASLELERSEAKEKQARAEAPVREVERLSERLRQCRQELVELESSAEHGDTESAPIPIELRSREAELETQLAQLRRAASQVQRGKPPSTAASSVEDERRASQLTEQGRSLREALATEQRHARSAAPALDSATDSWLQAARRLHDELVRTTPTASAPDFASLEAVAEAAKWHAEARAFHSEIGRIERLQAEQSASRDAEREGWRDFSLESARLRQRSARSAAASGQAEELRTELRRHRDELQKAELEAQSLLASGSAARQRLDDAGARLHALRRKADEVGAEIF